MKRRREHGFALIAAILANLILLAVGFMAITLSTQDLRISMKVVGDKKAMSAAEAATQWLLMHFDPRNPESVTRSNCPLTDLAGGLEPRSRFSISQPVPPTVGPAHLALTGYDMASTPWILVRYDVTVTGRNEDYRTGVTIETGLGYGPVSAESYR